MHVVKCATLKDDRAIICICMYKLRHPTFHRKLAYLHYVNNTRTIMLDGLIPFILTVHGFSSAGNIKFSDCTLAKKKSSATVSVSGPENSSHGWNLEALVQAKKFAWHMHCCCCGSISYSDTLVRNRNLTIFSHCNFEIFHYNVILFGRDGCLRNTMSRDGWKKWNRSHAVCYAQNICKNIIF